MFPVLVKIGPITIHTYGFLFAIGILSGILLSLRLAKKENIDSKIMVDLLFYIIIIALVGAKIFLFFTEIKFYLKYPGQIKNLITSGGTFYGGLIFAIVFGIWFIKKHKLNYASMADIISPSIALGHFFGRLGCFSAGCCYGRPAGDSFLGVTFTSPYAHNHTGVPLNTALYPTQLMESALNLLNFVILFVIFKKKKFEGQVFSLYIFNYSVIRFCMELFRGDPDRGYIFGGIDHPFTSLSFPQLLSIAGIIVAIILYRGYKKKGAQKNNP
jgi:phosphatidylglycerol:prolipoprotein diacylglycerol transferase